MSSPIIHDKEFCANLFGNQNRVVFSAIQTDQFDEFRGSSHL